MQLNNKPNYAWLDGAITQWNDCVLHARSQTAFWGANVFEGIRGYWNPSSKKMHLYKFKEHLSRLNDSMKCLDMPHKFNDDELIKGCIDLVTSNSFSSDIHIVIVCGFGFADNFNSMEYTSDTITHITALEFPRGPSYFNGLNAKISSWRRISEDCMPPRIKTGANYHNSRLAHHEAIKDGYDIAIFINNRGTISETPGACLAIVKNNEIITPPATSGVLEGITLKTVRELANKIKMKVTEREIDRTELYLADEIFICGTLCEIQPIVTVDHKIIGFGKRGKVVETLQNLYEYKVRNTTEESIIIDV